jgi:hypothetical protein
VKPPGDRGLTPVYSPLTCFVFRFHLTYHGEKEMPSNSSNSNESQDIRVSPRKRPVGQSSVPLPTTQRTPGLRNVQREGAFKTVLRPKDNHILIRLYLIAHNTFMFATWVNVLFWVFYYGYANSGDLTFIHFVVGRPMALTQLVALAELVHAVSGIMMIF